MPIEYQRKVPKQVLTPSSGFISDYTHSLNPYAGCAFGCSYCYVREMPISTYREQPWGSWVDIKEGAAEQLRRDLAKAKKKGPVRIFMSSSTDPYQPIEYREQLTRKLLEAMADDPPDFLMVQTRSPLVVRDIDLFLKLKDKIRVSVTVETDLDHIRKAFSPFAPPIQARIKALKTIRDAGVPNQAAISPMLPCTKLFPRMLADAVDRVCLDDLFMGDGMRGKRTEKMGIRKIYESLKLEKWYDKRAYLYLYEHLKTVFPKEKIGISAEGFKP